jgi:hypothetical protein
MQYADFGKRGALYTAADKHTAETTDNRTARRQLPLVEAADLLEAALSRYLLHFGPRHNR